MAWIQPVTDRLNGSARMTYIDMNRITGNLAFLYDFIREQGVTPAGSPYSKTNWTQNDIITTAEWTELLTCLTNVCAAVNYTPDTAPTSAMTYTNINNVEKIELVVYEMADVLDELARMNHWVGDPFFSGDPINAGGRYS